MISNKFNIQHVLSINTYLLEQLNELDELLSTSVGENQIRIPEQIVKSRR